MPSSFTLLISFHLSAYLYALEPLYLWLPSPTALPLTKHVVIDLTPPYNEETNFFSNETMDIINTWNNIGCRYLNTQAIYTEWPSKTDSAPVRGDGYEPESSKFKLRANAETSHSVRYDMVVVVASIVGGGEKFSHGMVRSRKPPPLVPRTIAATSLLSSYQGTCTIQHGCTAFDSIPRPLIESIDDLTLTDK